VTYYTRCETLGVCQSVNRETCLKVPDIAVELMKGKITQAEALLSYPDLIEDMGKPKDRGGFDA
jgi:hypothetical protein